MCRRCGSKCRPRRRTLGRGGWNCPPPQTAPASPVRHRPEVHKHPVANSSFGGEIRILISSIVISDQVDQISFPCDSLFRRRSASSEHHPGSRADPLELDHPFPILLLPLFIFFRFRSSSHPPFRFLLLLFRFRPPPRPPLALLPPPLLSRFFSPLLRPRP